MKEKKVYSRTNETARKTEVLIEGGHDVWKETPNYNRYLLILNVNLYFINWTLFL